MKRLLSQSFLYFSTNFLSKAVSFFLIPLFTNPAYLSPEGYGQILLFVSISLLLNPLIVFGGLDRIAINFFEKNADQSKIRRESNTTVLIFFLINTVVFLLFAPILTKSLGISLPVLLILPFSAYLNYYAEQLLIIIRFNGNAKQYFIIFLLKIIFDAGISVLCLTVFHWGWYSRIIGVFAGVIFTFIICLSQTGGMKNLAMPFGKLPLRKIVATGFPFVLVQFFFIGLSNLDKVIIPQTLKKEELAIYGVAFQLCYLLPTVTTTLMSITQPMVYKILSQPTAEGYNRLKKMITLGFGAIAVTAVGIYFITPLFYHFVKNPKFHEGIYLVKYLLVAWIFWCCGTFLIDIVKKLGTRMQIINSYLIPFIVFIISMYFLSYMLGLMGVALSLIISYGCLFITIGFFTRKQLRLALGNKI
jgi:O-antigen/teichoic acid export membrane protein